MIHNKTMQYNGITDSYWFEQYFLLCLPQDTVIFMDNAAFHREKQLFKIVKKHNKTLIFLSPYSPELNPIEKFWASSKQKLKINIRFFNSLNDAIFDVFNLS